MQKLRSAAIEIEKRAIAGNYKRDRYAPDEILTQHQSNFMGLVSEYAAHLYFEIDFDWEMIYIVGHSDLANGHEVRSTTCPTGHLLTYDKDKLACYILAVVNLQQLSVDLKGWLHIDECRQLKYWRDKPQVREASYWTPQSDLKPMLQLVTL